MQVVGKTQTAAKGCKTVSLLAFVLITSAISLGLHLNRRLQFPVQAQDRPSRGVTLKKSEEIALAIPTPTTKQSKRERSLSPVSKSSKKTKQETTVVARLEKLPRELTELENHPCRRVFPLPVFLHLVHVFLLNVLFV